MKKLVFLFALSLLFSMNTGGQTVFRIQTGVGYMEHFSVGVGVNFATVHQLSFLYGSNLFVRPNDFSSLLLQYQRSLRKPVTGPFKLNVGIKSGYTVYSDTYYQWKLITGIPYAGISRDVGSRTEIFTEAGVAFSRLLSLKRLEMGKIGWYREVLPEIKIGIAFKL